MKRSTHTLAIKSQNWITEAMLELMKEKPYDEITVCELCNKAQLDRRTFYRNFKDKDDIIQFHIEQLQKEYLEELRTVKIRTIRSMAKAQFEFWKNHMDFLTALKNNNFLTGLLLNVSNQFIPSIYEEFHYEIPENFQYKAFFIIGGFCNILLNWISNGAVETPEEIASLVSELFDEKNPYWANYVQS